jgi:hypothetical protein
MACGHVNGDSSEAIQLQIELWPDAPDLQKYAADLSFDDTYELNTVSMQFASNLSLRKADKTSKTTTIAIVQLTQSMIP